MFLRIFARASDSEGVKSWRGRVLYTLFFADQSWFVVVVVVKIVVVVAVAVVGRIAHSQQVEIAAAEHCFTQQMFAAGSSQSLACCRRFEPSFTDLKRG